MDDDAFRRQLTAAALTGLLADGVPPRAAAPMACEAAGLALAEYRRLAALRSDPAAAVPPGVRAPQPAEPCDCWRCCAAELAAAGPH